MENHLLSTYASYVCAVRCVRFFSPFDFHLFSTHCEHYLMHNIGLEHKIPYPWIVHRHHMIAFRRVTPPMYGIRNLAPMFHKYGMWSWYVRQWSQLIQNDITFQRHSHYNVVECWYSHQNQFAHTQNNKIFIVIPQKSPIDFRSERKKVSGTFFALFIPCRLQIIEYRNRGFSKHIKVSALQHVHPHIFFSPIPNFEWEVKSNQIQTASLRYTNKK